MVKWFWLIYRMATSKTGVSIAEMQRELEVRDYRTMWVMAHKIRKAMADRDSHYRLAGLVEVDESLFGPSSSGKPGSRGGKKERGHRSRLDLAEFLGQRGTRICSCFCG